VRTRRLEIAVGNPPEAQARRWILDIEKGGRSAVLLQVVDIELIAL
jgi:hypothetical protein